MNFEKIENVKTMYPERASARLAAVVEDLKKLEEGKLESMEINEDERKEILDMENKLGENLEKIFKISIVAPTFYPEYFLTEKGRDDFLKLTGIKIKGESEQEIVKELLSQRKVLAIMNSKDQTALAGRSRTYSEDNLLKNLLSGADNNGNLNLSGLRAPEQINITTNVPRTLEKLSSLRNFKQEIRKIYGEVKKDNRENVAISKNAVLKKYAKRINELIAQEFYVGVFVKKMADIIGEENLNEDEKKLLDLFIGLEMAEKNYSRYDKFIHGASVAYQEDGEKTQISAEIREFADVLEKEYLENELNKKANIERKGLDWKKLTRRNVHCSRFSFLAEEMLELYGQKSNYAPSEYYKEREGAAPDDKWQFVARPEYKEMSVSSLQKAIFSPVDNKSIQDTIGILLGHEIEGHFIQALNRMKINLRIARKIGTDRTYILAEGGAMMVQDRITREAFGYKSLPWAHYVKAMIKKLEGGNYFDCVKGFYDSAIKASKLKKEKEIINNEEFQQEVKEKLKLAINRAKRLFRENVDLNLKSNFLTKSKDTVYLEQMMLLDRMKKEGLEKYALVGGCDPESLIDFVKAGLIKSGEIQEPLYFSLKTWERCRNKYLKS